jgi:hypothetical protein
MTLPFQSLQCAYKANLAPPPSTPDQTPYAVLVLKLGCELAANRIFFPVNMDDYTPVLL